jgi:hypothetical protein
MDNLVFDEAVNSTIDQSEFISKKWVYVNDNNSQNYSSQIVIDSTPLSNAGGWINWSEAYMVLPLVVQLTSLDPASLPFTAGANLDNPVLSTDNADYAWAFKNGFWNMINSMNVEFNNQNIIQQTPLTNVFRSFKAHTSFSQDDLLNEGSSIGYSPDNAGSWKYSTADSADGRGLSNNRDAPLGRSTLARAGATIYYSYPDTAVAGQIDQNATTGIYSGASNPSSYPGGIYAYNDGLQTRQTWYGYDAQDSSQKQINPLSTCSQVYRSSKYQDQAGSVVWRVFAKLRLKDLNEYFEKCPLLKGSTIRFYLNTNQALTTFTTTAPTIDAGTGAVSAGTITNTSVQVIGGLTNPLMVASRMLGSGASCLASDTYQLSVSIFKNTFQQQTTIYNAGQSPLSAVRLYAPVYQFNPLAQQRYLQLAPTKKVVYRDIFQYQFSVNANDSFNFLVSNGIPNIKSVCVVPVIPGTANGGFQYSTLMSPFATTGGTPDPITLTNFNILVSGVNLFLNNQLYDYEQFRQELMSSNQLNGNLTTGLTSGLISEEMFSRGYRYYYGNCSRILPAEAGVSRSIQIIGQNASTIATTLLVFVEFEKSMTIDIATGARID